MEHTKFVELLIYGFKKPLYRLWYLNDRIRITSPELRMGKLHSTIGPQDNLLVKTKVSSNNIIKNCLFPLFRLKWRW
jgi:hypothetical protein